MAYVMSLCYAALRRTSHVSTLSHSDRKQSTFGPTRMADSPRLINDAQNHDARAVMGTQDIRDTVPPPPATHPLLSLYHVNDNERCRSHFRRSVFRNGIICTICSDEWRSAYHPIVSKVHRLAISPCVLLSSSTGSLFSLSLTPSALEYRCCFFFVRWQLALCCHDGFPSYRIDPLIIVPANWTTIVRCKGEGRATIREYISGNMCS